MEKETNQGIELPGTGPTEREGDRCICELDGNVQGENEEFKMNRKRLGQTRLRKRTKARLNTVIPKRAHHREVVGDASQKGAACTGRCVIAR